MSTYKPHGSVKITHNSEGEFFVITFTEEAEEQYVRMMTGNTILSLDYPTYSALVNEVDRVRPKNAGPSHELIMAEIYKWADEIRLPSGYDGDLDALRKRLAVLLNGK